MTRGHALNTKAVSKKPVIGIVGAGVAGTTIALYLSQHYRCEVRLLDKNDTVVNGPPICHLHAGGNLYREIPDEECLALLEQSVETLRFYPHCANVRPTVLAVPTRDPGSVDDLLPRLAKLQQRYQALIDEDPANAVLGPAEAYYRLYTRAQMAQLAGQPLPRTPLSADDWMIPVARSLDFNRVKWPLIQVQEYGLSVFRLAANASLALANQPNCQVLLNTRVTGLRPQAQGWQLQAEKSGKVTAPLTVDYLVNAGGHRSGELDDWAGLRRPRWVEFKAAYLTRWSDVPGNWPELVFHGARGTPEGMAQLTPYADGHFQLHGMTDEITLFPGGLSASTDQSAQPVLAPLLARKLSQGWQAGEIGQRSRRAIAHLAHFIPAFASAEVAGKPLFGAQQIPGSNADLRAAGISFAGHDYARAEIVKANSALPVARALAEYLMAQGRLQPLSRPWQTALSADAVERTACELALRRDYPEALARRTGQSL
ncbi:FAD-dependent oxidoreductase [Ferrimonas gelatinilytica]|uniref:FAD-dependent oxidoreductase n=1 Tax=Ferrimonas gelatinilytica TaxID=1255257 RepID=A0ABP9RX56_9GAMM